MTLEQWKGVFGLENYYEVSSSGKVRNMRTGKLLSTDRKKGYVKVTLQVSGKKHYKLVHRLVAEVFLLNAKGKPTVNHKNGIKYDNRLENLEWATYSENMQHAFDNGYKIPFFRGDNVATKLDKDDIFAVNVLIKKGITNKVIAELFNVSPSLISSVRKGRSK